MGKMNRTYKNRFFSSLFFQIFPHSITSLCHFPRVYRISDTPKYHQNGLLILSENKSTSFQTNTLTTGWWFGTCFIFHFIYGIFLPIDFHIFRDDYIYIYIYTYIYIYIKPPTRPSLAPKIFSIHIK